MGASSSRPSPRGVPAPAVGHGLGRVRFRGGQLLFEPDEIGGPEEIQQPVFHGRFRPGAQAVQLGAGQALIKIRQRFDGGIPGFLLQGPSVFQPDGEHLQEGGFRGIRVVGLLFTGRADIKNDMLSLQSISGKHNQTPKEWSCQSKTGGNFLEQIQFSELESFKN